MTIPLSHMVADNRSVGASCHDEQGAATDRHDTAISKAMCALYAEVDADIAARNPVCTNRGVCCKFAQYGHRLYVTDVELAHFVQGQSEAWREPEDSGACPYQIEGRCTAREHRPLGCRVFFCDPASGEWQGPVYEAYLARLKQLGEQLGVPYRYREWLSALRDPDLSTAIGSDQD